MAKTNVPAHFGMMPTTPDVSDAAAAQKRESEHFMQLLHRSVDPNRYVWAPVPSQNFVLPCAERRRQQMDPVRRKDEHDKKMKVLKKKIREIYLQFNF